MINTAGFSFEPGHYLDLLPDLVCVTDSNGRLISINSAWTKLSGYPDHELIDRPLINFIHVEDQPKVLARLKALHLSPVHDPLLLRSLCKNGACLICDWRTIALNSTVFWISRDKSADIETQSKMQSIVDASGEFLEMPPGEIDYQRIADQLCEISGAKYAVVNIYNKDGSDYTTKAIAGIKDSIKRASEILGFSLVGKTWPNDPQKNEKTGNQSITSFSSLGNYAGHALPRAVIRLLEAAFSIGQVCVAKIERDGILLGDFTLLMHDGEEFHQHALVEIYTRQVGLLVTRHRAELAMKESEAKFRDLFDKDLTGNFISTVDGEFILINDAFARIFGFDTAGEMMLNRAEITYVQDGDRAKFLDLIRKHRHLDLFEEKLRRRDGSEITVLENVVGEFDENNVLIRLKGYLIDITDRKRIENNLLESERLLKESQEISGIGSYVLEITTGVWKGSMVLDNIFGLKPTDDHSLEGWQVVVHPDDRAMMDYHFLHDVLELRGRFDKEYRIIQNNSLKELWVHGIGEVEFDQAGHPLKMVGTIQDITERRVAREALIQSEEKYRMIVEQIDEVIFVLNNEGIIEYMSPVVMQLSGFPADYYINQHFGRFILPENLQSVVDSFQDLRNGISNPSEFRVFTKDGEECWVRSTTKQIFKDSEITGFRGVVQNITREKKDEILLREALRKAEASDHLKTAFLNNISHEVRTPLNGILGFGEMITEPDLSPETKAFYLEILNSSSDRLLNTINDYMDISMLSSETMEMRPSLFNLADLVNSLAVRFKPVASTKGIDIKVFMQDLPKSFLLDTDGELLRKVLVHLLDNAVKYSSSGCIELSYSAHGEELEFVVRDEGIGISPEKLDSIFDYFIQEDSSVTRRYEGSGLGLSIVKGIVTLLGGRIWVESKKGQGSSFYFTISNKR